MTPEQLDADWALFKQKIGDDLFKAPEHSAWGTPHSVVAWGADRIDVASIRRYVEPLEFDCALHHDAGIARSVGYADIIAPVTSLGCFSLQALWSPGDDSVFKDAERDAQPTASVRGDGNVFPLVPPRYTAYFGTDFELDVVRPATVGDRIGRRGSRLLECITKSLAIGSGAFIKWQTDIVDERLDVVARFRVQMFVYEPRSSSS